METVSCSLNRERLTERSERWHRLADRAFARRVQTDGGQRLEFPPEPGVEQEVRELAELERECCSFADWRVQVENGVVVLAVGGRSEEGVAAVQAMFTTLSARACR
jgi:hypothetical protein